MCERLQNVNQLVINAIMDDSYVSLSAYENI